MNRTARGRHLLAGSAVALVVTGTVSAAALDASTAVPDRNVPRAEAVVLIRQAASDPTKLDELRTVDQIDGQPIDVAAVIDVDGQNRQARLTELADQLDEAQPAGTAGLSTDDARRSAEEVLDARKYKGNRLPQPFRGPLTWVADRLSGIGDFLSPITSLVWVQVLLFVGVLAGAGFIATRLIVGRSRAAVRHSRGDGRLVDPSLDPEELDRQADDAFESGDHEAAVRLRYEAGLLRLARSGLLDLRIATTARAAARQVDQPSMDRLTDDFERVVYGGRAATAADVDAARRGWAEVLGVGAKR